MFGRKKDPSPDTSSRNGAYTEKHGEQVNRVELTGDDLKYGQTQRKLKSRHIQLIALGKLRIY